MFIHAPITGVLGIINLTAGSGKFLRNSHRATGRYELGPQCPSWVTVGHDAVKSRCPLYPRKRTLDRSRRMSAKGQKQTFCAAVENVVIRSPRRPARAAYQVLREQDPERPFD
jgi:hypothetical protein